MLELKNITKIYEIGKPKDKDYQVTHALKGVNIVFRDSEFVSVLGPSGCGKTTLLNIVGGLDKYTSGDLIINGRSTKEYSDKDWDNYRNNSVGFVFQSYNLIPHQTVLENVELALTLSGVSRKVRKQKAKEVLQKVGLADKINSKPNQLSGGQMQRVAIARALVNNPDIILADEPTGALDTQTSIQVMELLSEVAKERLVVMVTHNPDLAEAYSTRIVKMLDGNMAGDSNPISSTEKAAAKRKQQKEQKAKQEAEQKFANLDKKQQKEFKKQQKIDKKAQKKTKKSMSFFTALALSFKNLLTKKARTFLVAFAGSIGIIGIALVLSLSSGFSAYINRLQENTLSTYPLTINAKSIEFTALIKAMFASGDEKPSSQHGSEAVYVRENMAKLIDDIGDSRRSNNLQKFNEYIIEHKAELEPYVNAIKYSYNMKFSYATSDANKNIDASESFVNMIILYALNYFNAHTGITFTKQNEYLYMLYKPEGIDDSKPIEEKYPFVYIENDYGADLGPLVTQIDTSGQAPLSKDKVLELVFLLLDLQVSADTMSAMGKGATSSLFQSDIITEMLDNQKLIKSQYELVGNNSRYLDYSADHATEAMLVLDKNNELNDYVLYALGYLSDDQMNEILKGVISKDKVVAKVDYDDIIGSKIKVLDEIDYFVTDPDDGVVDFRTYAKSDNPANLQKYVNYLSQAYANCTNELTIVGVIKPSKNANVVALKTGVTYSKFFTQKMIDYRNTKIATFPEGSVSISSIDISVPSSIAFYIGSFKSKDSVKKFIEEYNRKADANDRIAYSDTAGEIMSTVSTIINAITYVLIAFVSISLVVSSIMIGIITYISVLERTKEIGVLRSVGASKRDIKRVFTAESLIIGFIAGMLGIIITLILNIPINIIISKLADISGVASLPWLAAIILVAISMTLTFIAGLVPANIASKKDPVIALRTE